MRKKNNVDKAIVITRLTGTLALSALIKLADRQFGESVAYATGFSEASGVMEFGGAGSGERQRVLSSVKAPGTVRDPKPDVNANVDFIRMEFANESNALQVEAKKMDKQTALQTIKPYKFTIKNTGTVNFDANLYLEVLSNTLNLKKDDVSLYIKDELGNVVFDGNFEEAKELLNKNIRINEASDKTFSVWAWLDAPTTVYDGDIVFKMSAYATQVKDGVR